MKKLKMVSILPVILLTGCFEEDFPPEIKVHNRLTLQGSTQAATFIVDCARAANPLSDEEGEDLVLQCQNTAEDLFGKREYYGYFDDSYWDKGCFSETHKETLECMNILLKTSTSL